MDAEIGSAAEVESNCPKKVAMRALLFLIGKNHQRAGTCAAVVLMIATRSSLRL